MAHMKEKEPQSSHIKLIIKLHATSSSMPRKQLVLYLPRSPKQKRDPSDDPSSSDIRCNKRCKLVASHIEYSSVTNNETTRTVTAKYSRTVHDHEISAYPTKSAGTAADKCGGFVKEKGIISKTGCEDKEKKKPQTMRVVKKDSRFVSKEKCEVKGVNNSCSKKKKMGKVATDKASAIKTDQYPTKPSTQCCGVVKEKGRVGSRISRSGCEEECKLKKNKKEEKKTRVMDHCKKMQCWVMLKRLMTGKDSWVFKQPMMGLEILDNKYSVVDHHHHESKSVVLYNNETTMKPSDLKDIESKLKKCLYTEPGEFADDIRVVFSYGLLHPPTNDIYKITRRLSEDFELNWKSLKDKWLSEERKERKKI